MRDFIALFIFLLSTSPIYCINNTIKTEREENSFPKINIVPDQPNHIYKIGEPAIFKLSIKNKNTISPYTVYYEIGPEKMPPTKKGSFSSCDSDFVIEGGTMNTPGFLRCSVTLEFGNEKYSEISTVAYEPEKIKHTVKCPKDFEKFWNAIKLQGKSIPLDINLTLIEEKCTEFANFYQVDYQNLEFKDRFYGILSIPKKNGKFPAVIRFPGAGVKPVSGNVKMAENDVITLDLYIHPFPLILEKCFYDNLAKSHFIDYKFWGVKDKNTYYYKRVISGCLKAIDVIYSLPQFDGENLAAWGSSQGGALSVITTALDKRIKILVALCPAMCDFTGYLHGRAGGWPHFFNEENIKMFNNKKVLETIPYYDVVNFARMITVPGFYSWGFNDETTPPTSFYSAYNVIKAPKKLFVIPNGKHEVYPEQIEKTNAWILNYFKNFTIKEQKNKGR